MFEKFKVWFFLAISGLLLIYILNSQSVLGKAVQAFHSDNASFVTLSIVSSSIKTVAADPTNRLALEVYTASADGSPASDVDVSFKVDGGGSISPSKVQTDSDGRYIISYVPPLLSPQDLKQDRTVTITASIPGISEVSALKINLTNIPAVFVHGYQASGYVFDNLKDYLADRNIKGSAITYKSENGVVSASNELSAFLYKQKHTYLSQGFQVNKFNIIAHSMGGLVTRYYSISNDNLKNNNIEKIIFLAVPHKGSPWASIGLNQYNDQGIRDMIPDGNFLSNILPTMFNKGLNSGIQTANIAVEYDEVVDQDSGSLDEWGIKTEIFNVGGNNFSVNNLLNGNLTQAINHKSILSNKKVFERVFEMLSTQLEYPKKSR